ncbi:MAG: hypothetical protein ACOC0P_05550, partial [Planctomycetota bacterium]
AGRPVPGAVLRSSIVAGVFSSGSPETSACRAVECGFGHGHADPTLCCLDRTDLRPPIERRQRAAAVRSEGVGDRRAVRAGAATWT